MYLAYGFSPGLCKLDMSSQKKYHPQQLFELMQRQNNTHHWVLVDNFRVQIHDTSQLYFACNLVSAYHNSICQNEDYIDISTSMD